MMGERASESAAEVADPGKSVRVEAAKGTGWIQSLTE